MGEIGLNFLYHDDYNCGYDIVYGDIDKDNEQKVDKMSIKKIL